MHVCVQAGTISAQVCVDGWTGAHEDLWSVRKVAGLGKQGEMVQEE